MNHFYIIIFPIINIVFLFLILWLIFRPKKFVEADLNNSLSVNSNETGRSKILKIIGKILKIIILGYLYFFMTAMSVMATDSCGIDDCKILGIGLTIGALWMLISFIVTVLSIVRNKKIIPFISNTIFMPYLAIPIFFGIIMLAMTLEGM